MALELGNNSGMSADIIQCQQLTCINKSQIKLDYCGVNLMLDYTLS